MTNNYNEQYVEPVVSDETMATQSKSTVLDVYAYGVNPTNMPVHIAMAKNIEGSIAKQLATIADYTSRDTKDVGDFIGQAVTIVGAAVIKHGGFSGRDGQFHPEGYHYLVLKTDQSMTTKVMHGDKVLKIESPVMIKTSAGQVVDFFLSVMQSFGWFDWPFGVTVSFKGSKDSGYSVLMIDAVNDTVK